MGTDVFSKEGIRAFLQSSARLMKDAMKVSEATMPGLIELALEEVIKAWWVYFSMHPELANEYFLGTDFREKIKKRSWQHEVKIEEMISITRFIRDMSHKIEINNNVVGSKTVEYASYYTKDKNKLADFRNRAYNKVRNLKSDKLIDILTEPANNLKVNDLKGLKENSFYVDVDKNNNLVIQPKEPDWKLVLWLCLFNLVSYEVLDEEMRDVSSELMTKLSSNAKFNSILSEALRKANIKP